MATIKALIPGAALTLVISAILYSGGTRSGVFALQHASLANHDVYWSWPLFVVTFGLSRALLWMMDS